MRVRTSNSAYPPGPSGVPTADRLRDAWLTKVQGVVAELDQVSPSAAFGNAEGSTPGVDRLVQSLTPPQPDLPALTKKHPLLPAAYRHAARCAPGWKPAGETPAPGALGRRRRRRTAGTPAPVRTASARSW
ncbi:hypothetical protein [Streptomyces sp. NPDC006274]|uniref:hypothetical protein n=1 Tax=unclassified Streptomyces TaxID=2593676 RepID=UPI0033AFD404